MGKLIFLPQTGWSRRGMPSTTIGDARPRCRLDSVTPKGRFDGMICKVYGTIR